MAVGEKTGGIPLMVKGKMLFLLFGDGLRPPPVSCPEKGFPLPNGSYPGRDRAFLLPSLALSPVIDQV